jgi:uncharacterized membrane protein
MPLAHLSVTLVAETAQATHREEPSMLATEQTRPLAPFHHEQRVGRVMHEPPNFDSQINVGTTERNLSLAAGSILALLGLARRDLTGLLIAGVGGGLLYRGATGHCHTYEALGIDTADEEAKQQEAEGFHVVHSCLIGKSPQELYERWRKLENLPDIMSHLQSVKEIDDRRSHWVASAPAIAGGKVKWEAEIIDDVPNERIAWRSLPGSYVENQGSVQFVKMPGDRGTAVRVELDYQPPAGRLGKWVAKLFGEAPDQQICEDLRSFKRVMEIGEEITTEGQPHGKCMGLGLLRRS